jgi:hypothetical protein
MINALDNTMTEVEVPKAMFKKVEALQDELLKLTQYEPKTDHYFHGGMYCRKVFRHAGVLVIGKVHKKEHFYLILSGTVAITDGNGTVEQVTGPHLFLSKPGTKRAVFAVTDATCMTFHATEYSTVEEAESQLVEDEINCGYEIGNIVKHQLVEVSS